jgi:peptidoglycan/LPS O-acetylase OafA/YrhL
LSTEQRFEPMQKRRGIPSLDGMRAVSILLVFVAHATFTFPRELRNLRGWTIVGNASLGVSTFFVISGFLITTLLLKELDAFGTISLPRFYLRRAFRIFIPFYAYLAVLGAIWACGIVHLDAHSFAAAATYTWNYALRADGWFLAHAWSLSVEEQFYLFWPAVLLMLGRKRAIWFAVACIVASPFVRVATYVLAPGTRDHIGMMLHTRVDVLMAGSLLALLWTDDRFQSHLQRLFHNWIVGAVAVFLLVVSPILNNRFAGAYRLPIGFSTDALGIALLLAYVVKHPGSLAGRVLNSRVLMRIGVMSYSLYLWQQLFLTSFFGHFPLNIVLAFAIGELSYRLVESPSLRLREWLEARWSAMRMAAQSQEMAASAD